MPNVTKFDGYLVNPQDATRIVTPAYDAMLPSERRAFAEQHSRNYVNVMRTLDEFPDSSKTIEDILAHNQLHLTRLLESGSYRRVSSPAFFLYRLRSGSHEQTGVIADIPISDYADGLLKKHEDTRSDKEDMLTQYQEVVGVTSSPVCVSYADQPEITEVIEETQKQDPYLRFCAWDDVDQAIWEITDEDLSQQLECGFKDIKYTYLTDGHHRCASGVRFSEVVSSRADYDEKTSNSSKLMVALFPKSQMRIYSYFRCLRDLNGLSESDLICAIEKTGIKVEKSDCEELTSALLPDKAREITMVINGRAYLLEIPEELVPINDPNGSLDVSILQDQILAPILGIHDARSDSRLSYIPGVFGMKGILEQSLNGWPLGFACVDTTIQEVVDVADAGLTMPPKSTWFDPKLRAGIFLRYC